jgi:regulator of sigma E protease
VSNCDRNRRLSLGHSGASKLSFLSLPVLLSIPAFVLVLTVIVFVHEMGHYLVARWNGIAIQTFSLGFGRELIGFNDRHGTRWRISAIPLGGYVRFVGDMNAASMPDPELVKALPPEDQARLFVNKNVWQRIAVVVAGPVANVLLTFLILYVLVLSYGRYTVPPVLGDVKWGSVAMRAGLLPGDRILGVDGFAVNGLEDFDRLISTSPDRKVTVTLERGGAPRTLTLVPTSFVDRDRFGNELRVGDVGLVPPPPVVTDIGWGSVAMWGGLRPGDMPRSVNGAVTYTPADFQRMIAGAPGKTVTVRVARDGRDQSVVLVPRDVSEKDASGKAQQNGRIGVTIGLQRQNVTLYRPNPVEAVGMTFEEIRFIVDRTAAFLGDFFVGRGDVQQLGGPIKVAKVSGEVATLGIVALINLAALLSLNIGIFNLLPVPVLDGGHLLYYVIEAVRGRPLSQRAQEIGYRVGFAIVGSLMIFTLLNDTLLEALRHVSG